MEITNTTLFSFPWEINQCCTFVSRLTANTKLLGIGITRCFLMFVPNFIFFLEIVVNTFAIFSVLQIFDVPELELLEITT